MALPFRTLYEQHLEHENAMQQEKGERKREADAARSRQAELEEEVRAAKESLKNERDRYTNLLQSYQTRLKEAAELRGITLDASQPFGDQLTVFFANLHGSAMVTGAAQMIKEQYDARLASLLSIVRRSSEAHGFKQYDDNTLDTALHAYVQEVTTKCTAYQAHEDLHRRLATHVDEVYQNYAGESLRSNLSFGLRLDSLFDKLDSCVDSRVVKATTALSADVVDAIRPLWEEMGVELSTMTIVEQVNELAQDAINVIASNKSTNVMLHARVVEMANELGLAALSSAKLSTLQLLNNLQASYENTTEEAQRWLQEANEERDIATGTLFSIAKTRQESALDLRLVYEDFGSEQDQFANYVSAVTAKIADLQKFFTVVSQLIAKLKEDNELSSWNSHAISADNLDSAGVYFEAIAWQLQSKIENINNAHKNTLRKAEWAQREASTVRISAHDVIIRIRKIMGIDTKPLLASEQGPDQAVSWFSAQSEEVQDWWSRTKKTHKADVDAMLKDMGGFTAVVFEHTGMPANKIEFPTQGQSQLWLKARAAELSLHIAEQQKTSEQNVAALIHYTNDAISQACDTFVNAHPDLGTLSAGMTHDQLLKRAGDFTAWLDERKTERAESEAELRREQDAMLAESYYGYVNALFRVVEKLFTNHQSLLLSRPLLTPLEFPAEEVSVETIRRNYIRMKKWLKGCFMIIERLTKREVDKYLKAREMLKSTQDREARALIGQAKLRKHIIDTDETLRDTHAAVQTLLLHYYY